MSDINACFFFSFFLFFVFVVVVGFSISLSLAGNSGRLMYIITPKVGVDYVGVSESSIP